MDLEDENLKFVYGKHGPLKNWGERNRRLNRLTARSLANFLEVHNLLGDEKGRNKVLYSPTANTAEIENELVNCLGDNIKIIAGDMSDVSPASSNLTFVMLNAKQSPLPNASVDILLDWRGASWHSVIDPGSIRRVANLYEEYRRILKPDGYVIIDRQTAENMDYKDMKPDGFEYSFLKNPDDNFGMFYAGILRKVDKLEEFVQNGLTK